jgi:CheY-like chemotaxis protein
MISHEPPVEILLVEDSPDDSAFFVHALAKAGVKARLHVVVDGAQALEYFFGDAGDAVRSASLPRLVVLDLKLPKVDGLEVLRTLKTNPRTQPIPVVVLSSSLEERDLAASYRLGANSYILKPMDFDHYGDCVRTLARYWVEINRTPKPGTAE